MESPAEAGEKQKGEGEPGPRSAVRHPVWAQVMCDFEGREQIDRGVLKSSRESSVARWKTPVKGDVVVEMDLTPLEAAQNIVVDFYY